MSNHQTDKETERFYKISYLFIPLPMIAGLAFAIWVINTEDSREKSYCTVAKSASAYEKLILIEDDFIDGKSTTLDICKDKDATIDDADGRTVGKVRWFVCKGTTCGPGWQTILSEK